MMNDDDYMNFAIKEALKAENLDEVPVGAIIVNQDNDIIGKGFNSPISKNDPTSHAEINAIRMASASLNNYRLINTTLYVTIEPCVMCMGAIIHARIKRVVFGADDPKWGGAKSLYNFSEDKRFNHAVEIKSGVLKEKTKQLIKQFFINKRSE